MTGRHFAGQHRLLKQISRRLRYESPFAGLPHEVTRSADALQGSRDISRRLDLADEIHRPHVDAHFERRRGDDGGDESFLEGFLDVLPHLQSDTPVMGPRQVAFFIEKSRDALDGTAIVGEDDGRSMCANQVGQHTIDGRPDRFFRQGTKLFDGADDAQVEVFPLPGIDDRHRPCRDLARGIYGATAKVACHLVQRPLCRRETDAHERGATLQDFESLQKKGKKYAALYWCRARESHRR